MVTMSYELEEFLTLKRERARVYIEKHRNKALGNFAVELGL